MKISISTSISDLFASSPAAGWGREQDETRRGEWNSGIFDICLMMLLSLLLCQCVMFGAAFAIFCKNFETLLIHIGLLEKICDHLLRICRLLIVPKLDHKNSFAFAWICKNFFIIIVLRNSLSASRKPFIIISDLQSWPRVLSPHCRAAAGSRCNCRTSSSHCYCSEKVNIVNIFLQ